jgi:hypothetical protein
MTPLAKGLVLLFGVPVVLGIGFFYYFSATGEERMRNLCVQVKPGISLDQLKAFAQENNIRTSVNQEGTSFLGDARSYGRHTCKVVVEAGIVKSADYSFAD